MTKVGAYLRRVRLKRGHTLADVGAALGRGTSWVSDVEHGRRGMRMDPVLAVLWADYLAIDAQPLLDALGLSGDRAELARVRHYLETGQWAHKFLRAQDQLGEALELVEQIQGTLVTGNTHAHVARDDLNRLKTLVKGCQALLRTPRKGN